MTVSLSPSSPNAGPANNVAFVQDFVANLLRTAFPHLSDNQIKITVTGLFNLDQDIPAFKEHLRDFLVQIREYTGTDDSDLFLEEREGALKKAQEEKRKIQIAVPGILNPHEMPEEMQEMWKHGTEKKRKRLSTVWMLKGEKKLFRLMFSFFFVNAIKQLLWWLNQ